jgi:hypothetical protein
VRQVYPKKRKGGNMAKKKWIQKAIKKPGSLKRIAKKAGKLTKKGTIKTGYL